MCIIATGKVACAYTSPYFIHRDLEAADQTSALKKMKWRIVLRLW